MNPNQKHQPVLILTHPHGQKDIMLKSLTHSGIRVLSDVMIETTELSLTNSEKKALFDCRRILLTSKRGVDYLFRQVRPAEVLDKSFICVGKKTAFALEKKGIKPWWVSGGKTASDLVNELKHARFCKNEKWIAVLGNLAEDTLQNGLSDLCHFQRINIYETRLVKNTNQQTIEQLESKAETLVVCTSPSCFHAFTKNYKDHLHANVGFASIGPVTTKAMLDADINPVIEARQSTYEGLLLALKSKLTPIYR